MSEVLESYLAGAWRRGEGTETELVDPVHGNVLATASAKFPPADQPPIATRFGSIGREVSARQARRRASTSRPGPG